MKNGKAAYYTAMTLLWAVTLESACLKALDISNSEWLHDVRWFDQFGSESCEVGRVQTMISELFDWGVLVNVLVHPILDLAAIGKSGLTLCVLVMSCRVVRQRR